MELPFVQLGYTVVEEIPNTERNACYKVQKDGRYFFAKVNLAKDPSRIANELWWHQNARLLLVERGDIMTPEVYASGEKWFVSEWIEGNLLAERADAVAVLSKAAPYLAQVLVGMDGALAPLAASELTAWRVDEYVAEPLEAGIITPERVEAAKALIAHNIQYVAPWPQHGDFVPWHIMVKPSGDWVLFDAEHAGPAKSRYYDLAYLYSRVFTRLQSPAIAALILAEFIKLHDNPEFAKAFLPVMTQRAIGMHFDSLHDTAFADYTDRAQQLLDLCLAEDINGFIAAA